MAQTEKQIERDIIQFIRFKGGWCEGIQSGSLVLPNPKGGFRRVNMCTKGTPDIIACFNGKFLGIEVKKNEKEIEKWRKGKDKRSLDQQYQRDRILESKGIYIITHSIDDLRADLVELGLI